MSSIKITCPDDVGPAIVRVMGFTPTESLVIAGLGGSPTARVDLPGRDDDLQELVTSLAPAVSHWLPGGAIVAIFTEDDDAAVRVEDALPRILPGVQVLLSMRIYGAPDLQPTGQPEIDARRVVASRQALVDEAAVIDDADTAERMAIESYGVGRGAQAWVYLDRAVLLRGHQSEAMAGLAHALTNAIAPR